MCVEGWTRKRWNPAGIKITTVELPHRPVPSIPRGGANPSEHVNILWIDRVQRDYLQACYM
ncbi:hypothetical protein B0H14DRAFT_2717713, partial [Mycena olivaceomarginata]